jgi:hypothetical protein
MLKPEQKTRSTDSDCLLIKPPGYSNHFFVSVHVAYDKYTTSVAIIIGKCEGRTIRVDLGCGLGKLPGNTTIYPQKYPLWDIAFAPVFDYSSS